MDDTPIDPAPTTTAAEGTTGVSRRRLLTGGALTVGGALAGAGIGVAATGDSGGPTPDPGQARPKEAAYGAQKVPFHGRHQAGIATPAQAHGVFLGFELARTVDRAALGRMMRLLTDDAVRLTRGQAALADTEAELAALPARLTVTFGFGPGLFKAAGLDDQRPASLTPLPRFPIDRLQDRWSGGDLLIQICADDPLTVAHAQRMLTKDARTFARLRWAQRGFRRGRGVQNDGVTQHNLMGQLDGTANPPPGGDIFAKSVWTDSGPAWLRGGGTTLVLRRIRMELETWDAADTKAKEFTVGRRLGSGAPLTGTVEADAPDFEAKDKLGFPVISEFAHIRRAHVTDDRMRIFRRPYNYDDAPAADGRPDTGLLFASFQRDIGEQFLPIQRRLAASDLLNQWTTPIGSAVFAVPPGCAPGGWIGESLLG
ncbi:Dyp-type peroxidase [Streptomyces sp. RY43-2]|uniref:Dyp-type peroxidase n=1 Tax=Streptomyces macrolidinus TaxID=2952607 RepID=A0ABT0ZJT0_9ACTN|nr:Dyp-type peroxidase [Streptomyces macrolidinus]MCN9243811.1 Dyp-type peroxidase [Streptomyces macrolidinus]